MMERVIKLTESKADDMVKQNSRGVVVIGWKNNLASAIATVTPSDILAEKHRKMGEPGTGKK
jgi:hypothetical protein